MTVTQKCELCVGAVAMLLILIMDVCFGSDLPKSYGPTPSNDYQNNYESEFQRPLAVFTEKPINVADFILIPVIQVPSSDLRMIYRPQIDSVSKTEPVVMCKSLTKSFEATPAVQVPLQQPFYLYDERTLIPFPKTVTILHGGYRMSIPVGVVIAPVPAGAFKAGPIFVTTLYAIPAASPASPVPVRYVPWSSYPVNPSASQYLTGPLPPLSSQYSPPASPPSSTLYSQPAPPSYTLSAPPSPLYSNPAPPSSSYSHPAPPSSSYSHPAPPSSSYSHSAPPSSSYSHSAPPSPQLPYTHQTLTPLPAAYSQPAPQSPTYYQQSSNYDIEDSDNLRNRDPPGKLYSQLAANTQFHNSKESPLLHQLREESEKNRQKYAQQPSYSNQYQSVDA